MDSYGLDNCGYCWAVAEDGIIQHHKNCKIANLQALADKMLELLKRLEWVEYEPYSMVVYPEPKVWKECLICEHWFEHGHAPDCELAEAIDGV